MRTLDTCERLLRIVFAAGGTQSRRKLHYICIDWRHLEELLAAGRAAYSELKNLCVWAKNKRVVSRSPESCIMAANSTFREKATITSEPQPSVRTDCLRPVFCISLSCYFRLPRRPARPA